MKWDNIDMGELELEKMILHFAQSNRAEGKSPKTISWYTEMITCFARFLAGTNRRIALAEFNIDTVREFVIHEQGRGMSPCYLFPYWIGRLPQTQSG